jgi:hypothetical protein
MARDVSWRTPKRRLFSTPVPVETRTYKPVSHKQLAKSTLRAIRDAGFELGVEEYYSSKEGQVATARYTINNVKDEDMQLEIGWQNSYDKTLSLKFAIGTRIMICENGCVSGNFGSFARKHMADIQSFAPEEMKESILNAARVFDRMVEDKTMMKRHIIGEDRQLELAGKLFFKNQAFGSTQMNIINEQIKRPSFDYGAHGSIWEIYQYVTYAMKELHPRLWMEAHIDVHKFFLEEVDHHAEHLQTTEDSSKWRGLCNVSESRGITTAQLTEMVTQPVTREVAVESGVIDPAQLNLLEKIEKQE